MDLSPPSITMTPTVLNELKRTRLTADSRPGSLPQFFILSYTTHHSTCHITVGLVSARAAPIFCRRQYFWCIISQASPSGAGHIKEAKFAMNSIQQTSHQFTLKDAILTDGPTNKAR